MHQLCKLHWIFMVEFCWTEELKSDQRQFHFIQLRTNLKANSKTRFDSVMNRRETSKDMSELVCQVSIWCVGVCQVTCWGVWMCQVSNWCVGVCQVSSWCVGVCQVSVWCVRSVAGDVPRQYNYDDHFIITQLAGGWPCCQHFSLPRHPRADQPGCYQDGCQINKHLTSTSTQLNGTSHRCGSISSSGSVS